MRLGNAAGANSDGKKSKQRALKIGEEAHGVNEGEERMNHAAKTQVLDLSIHFSLLSRFERAPTRLVVAVSLLVLLAACQLNPIHGRTTDDSIHRSVLRVATSGDYSPFSDWPAGAREPVGFSASVAKAYARARDADLVWVRFRWPELESELASGHFDFVLSGVTVRSDRSKIGRFSIPLTTSGAIVLVAEQAKFSSRADLDQPTTRIAVNRGGHLERVTRHLFPRAQVMAIDNNATVLTRLSQGEADAVVSDSLEAPYWQALSESRLRPIGPLTRDLKAAFFPADQHTEVEAFNRWLLHAESTGELANLRAQHGLVETRTASPLLALLGSLDERLGLMREVAETKHALKMAIENSAREEIVLESAERAIRRAALEDGLNPPTPEAIRALFRAQIEAAKWIQNERLREISEGNEPTHTLSLAVARETLDELIRPALIDLGDRISMLVIACLKTSPKTLDYDEVATALARHDLPPPQLQAIHEALYALVMRGEKSARSHRLISERINTTPNALGRMSLPLSALPRRTDDGPQADSRP